MTRPQAAGGSTGNGTSRSLAAAALLVAGPASILFHVVYGISHGPTVSNENRVVLGLDNYAWARVAILWMALAAVGVVGVHRAQRGLASAIGATLAVTGFVLHAAAAWVFDLFVPATLALVTGLLVLAVAIVTAGRLPRWAGVAPAVAVVVWVPFAVAADAVYAFELPVGPVAAHGNDLIALAFGACWVVLGCALLAVRDRTKGGALRLSSAPADLRRCGARTARHSVSVSVLVAALGAPTAQVRARSALLAGLRPTRDREAPSARPYTRP